MKILYFILIIITCISCSDITAENKASIIENNSVIGQSKIETNQKKEKLIGTWYVKEILINGKPETEDYPVNNDEFILNQDMTMITIDKTFDMEDRGTWERISDSRFAVIISDDRVIFEILNLTDSKLETKMITEEIDMVIKYEKGK